MPGHVILSHGLESGPSATKVSALAEVAQALGWRVTRPDFRDLDASGSASCIEPRLARLTEQAMPGERLVLGGSSIGAFVSVLAARRLACEGLFLLALPPRIPGYSAAVDLPEVPSCLIHGWADEVCPVDEVIGLARSWRPTLHLVRDDHRLGAHVAFAAERFGDFLRTLGPA